MSTLRRTIAGEHSGAEHAAHYEALREHAMQRRPPIVRHGLAVLLRQGVAVWLQAWSNVPAGCTRCESTHTTRLSLVPNDVSAELVRVLTAMTMGHLQQVHT